MFKQSILEKVAEKITNSCPTITEKVIEILVDKELEKRTKVIITLIDKLEEVQKNGYKIKPIISYNEDGSVATTTWTKELLKEKNDNTEKINKLQDTINKALEGDFSKAFNYLDDIK